MESYVTQTETPRSKKKSSDNWPTPLPLAPKQPPELPIDIFTGWLGEMIDAVAHATETPADLPMSFGLAAIATAVQKRFSVLIKPGYFESLNVWMLCALSSGNRKTEVMRRMCKPLFDWENQQSAELLPKIAVAESARKTVAERVGHLRRKAAKAKDEEEFQKLSEEVAKLEETMPAIPSVPRLVAQDITPEHLGTLLSEHDERMSIVSDEGGIFDIIGGRYSNGIPNLDIFLQSHATSPVRVDRGSRPSVHLKHPALTMGLSPQPDVLRGLVEQKGFRGRGLLARFAYTLPASLVGYREGNTAPCPDSVSRAYQDAILRLANITPTQDGTPRVLMLSEEAFKVWDDYRADVEVELRAGERLEHLTDWGGKLPGLVARLAGLLHCAEYASAMPGISTIEKDTMERAIRLGGYLTHHAIFAFDLMSADEALVKARALWGVIERTHLKEFPERDAYYPLRSKYTADECKPGFEMLIELGRIRAISPTGAPKGVGRPGGRRFTVHPSLSREW